MSVEQPQFVLPQVTPQECVTVNAKTVAYNGKTTPESDTNHEVEQPQRPTSMVQGKASSQDLDSIFGDG
ncbi:hypothetical protein [Tolypothrix sp. VBCCA 56010]|uniref:hypothetical protein n=1 Tax=Tolypothrix sp. VBCCA 56010 TaxID=3137731 RepID=UPI003D7D04CB